MHPWIGARPHKHAPRLETPRCCSCPRPPLACRYDGLRHTRAPRPLPGRHLSPNPRLVATVAKLGAFPGHHQRRTHKHCAAATTIPAASERGVLTDGMSSTAHVCPHAQADAVVSENGGRLWLTDPSLPTVGSLREDFSWRQQHATLGTTGMGVSFRNLSHSWASRRGSNPTRTPHPAPVAAVPGASVRRLETGCHPVQHRLSVCMSDIRAGLHM